MADLSRLGHCGSSGGPPHAEGALRNRRHSGGIAAIIALVVVADVARSLSGTYRYEKKINRVAPSEVQLDGLQLTVHSRPLPPERPDPQPIVNLHAA